MKTMRVHARALLAIRHLGTVARRGPLKLAELRGLPLNNPATYTLTAPVPDHWTCQLHIGENLVTARCRFFTLKAQADSAYAQMASALDEALGRKGWAREGDRKRDMLASGTLAAESYEIKRDRRTVARATVSLTPPPVGVVFPGNTDRMVTLSVYSLVNSAAR